MIPHGVLARAVEWERIPTNPANPANPASAVPSLSGKRRRAVTPLGPATVEAMRSPLLAAGRIGDAALLSVLAYAGLRPREALALTWGHVGERMLLVEGAVSLGEVKETKTGHSRSVRLLAPLRRDLAEWRMAAGRPSSDALVFPDTRGEPWAPTAWKNWRRRIFAPAAEGAGGSTVTARSRRPDSNRRPLHYKGLRSAHCRRKAPRSDQLAQPADGLRDAVRHGDLRLPAKYVAGL